MCKIINNKWFLTFIWSFFLVGELPLLGDGISVVGKKEKSNPKKFTQEEITHIPGTFGDPLRSIETLPGVGVPSFFLGEFSIRGANTNANSYYLDNLPIGNPFHALGIHSVINKAMISGMEFHSGTYSSKYQNALGGVISIETPNFIGKLKDDYILELSLFSVSGSISKISENTQDYILVSGRASTMNITYREMGVLEEGFNFPDYYDAQIKAKKSITPNHSILFYGLYSRDKLSNTEINSNEEEPNPIMDGGEFSFGRGFSTFALRWEYETDKFKNQISLIYFKPWQFTNVDLANLEINTKEINQYYSIRQDAEYKDDWKNKWEFGTEIRQLNYSINGVTSYSARQRNLLPNYYSISDREFSIEDINASFKDVYQTVYTQVSIPSVIGVLNPGIRHEYQRNTRVQATSPRIRWDLTTFPNRWNLFFKGGRVVRYPTELVYGEDEPGNPNIEFEKLDSVSIGWSFPFQKLWLFQIEPFYQEFSDLVLRNESVSEKFENGEIGISKGIELIIRKKESYKGLRFYGWLSYTYSESLRRFPKAYKSDWIISDFDMRHSFNLVLGIKISKEWRFGMRLHARSSFPITPILGDDGGTGRNPYSRQRIYYPIYSEYENSARLPAYHRMDVRLDRTFNYSWGSINSYIEALNIYGRTNYENQNWNPAAPSLRETNPRLSVDVASFRLRNPGILLPLINLGMEVRF